MNDADSILFTFPGISKAFVSRMAQYYAEKSEARPERRGGARHSEEHKRIRQLIAEHIQSFTCRASHYGRRGAPGRKYLPSDLNVLKIHVLFEAQSHAQTSYSLYYSLFSEDFNIGFGHPAMDASADCAKYKIRIADPSLAETEKRMESASFILHRCRACAFYDLLGRVAEDHVTLCFDILPKTPIGQAYYSQQLYLYLFGVVVHHGENSHQTKDNVHLYV